MSERRDFAAQKFKALLRIATDGELPNLASRIAILLAAQYMRPENDGVAWPSIATLRGDLGVKSDSTIRATLSALVARGHFIAQHRPGETTIYRLANPAEKTIGDPAEFFTGDPAEKLAGVEEETPPKNAAGTPPNFPAATPPKNSATNTVYENRILKPDIFSADPDRSAGADLLGEKLSSPSKKTRAKARTAIAEDAQPTSRDVQAADSAGLSFEAFRVEWAKFRDWHISEGKPRADWSAAWRNWLRNISRFQRPPARVGAQPEFGNNHLKHLEDLTRD